MVKAVPMARPRGLIVRRPEHLTLDWARELVAKTAPRAEVSELEVLSVDVGTTTRVRLRVDHNGPLPRDWFVKLPSRSWVARTITGLSRLTQHEVRFYREIIDGLPVRSPKLLGGATRGWAAFTLVLEDVTSGGCAVGCAGDAISAEQAQAVVSALVRLHAYGFTHPQLSRKFAWLTAAGRMEDTLGAALAVPLMRRGLSRAGDCVPQRVRRGALAYARARRSVMEQLGRGSRTLVHHDCHPGNLYFSKRGPGFVDWQLARIGDGVGDIAYLLATGLESAVRRTHERDLVKAYIAFLAQTDGSVLAGVGGNEEAVFQRYRAHLAYAFEAMVLTLALGSLMPDPIAHRLVARVATAVDDHDAFAAVGL